MKILEVIESKRWVNALTNQTASIYGAAPYTDTDKHLWSIETVGWTWRMANGTIGLGRVPAKTKAEAIKIMEKFNK